MEHGEEIQMPEKVGQKIVMDTCRYYTYIIRLLSPFTHALTDNHLSVQYLQWIHIVYGVFWYWESSNSHTSCAERRGWW